MPSPAVCSIEDNFPSDFLGLQTAALIKLHCALIAAPYIQCHIITSLLFCKSKDCLIDRLTDMHAAFGRSTQRSSMYRVLISVNILSFKCCWKMQNAYPCRQSFSSTAAKTALCLSCRISFTGHLYISSALLKQVRAIRISIRHLREQVVDLWDISFFCQAYFHL